MIRRLRLSDDASRSRLAVAAALGLAALATAASASRDTATGWIAYSSNRSPFFTDHLYAYAPGAPPGRRLRTLGVGFAPTWSPNGGRIAFLRGDPGQAQLYVMNTDGSGIRQLTHTGLGETIANHQFLRWSPDGTTIAYVEEGPVTKLLNVANGTSNSIPDAPGVAWSPDGRHIAHLDLSKGYPTPLVVSNPDGNQPRTIAKVANGGEYAWSPNSAEIAFTSDQGGNLDLFVVGADGTGLRRLTNDRNPDSLPSWSPDGSRIVFFHAGPNDAYKGTLRSVSAQGGAERVLTQVTLDYGLQGPVSWSSDGKRIAFGLHAGRVLVLPSAGGGGQVLNWGWPPRTFSGAPTWRPRASVVLFSTHITANDQEIYLMRSDGQSVHPLTVNTVNDDDPSWSPDGRQIVFVRNGNPNVNGLWAMDANGMHQRRLTTGAQEATPEWSPNGRTIAFVHGDQLWTMRADGTARRRVLGLPVFPGLISWSPDGREIAFGNGSIYSVHSDGTHLRRLTSGAYDYGPAWSPDGRTIVFTGYDHPSNVPGQTGRGLFVIRPDGTDMQQILSLTASHPSWSPDGKKIVFQTLGNIETVNADGSGLTQLTKDGFFVLDKEPAWAPR